MQGPSSYQFVCFQDTHIHTQTDAQSNGQALRSLHIIHTTPYTWTCSDQHLHPVRVASLYLVCYLWHRVWNGPYRSLTYHYIASPVGRRQTKDKPPQEESIASPKSTWLCWSSTRQGPCTVSLLQTYLTGACRMNAVNRVSGTLGLYLWDLVSGTMGLYLQMWWHIRFVSTGYGEWYIRSSLSVRTEIIKGHHCLVTHPAL